MTYKKTELGQSALQHRSVAVSPRQRAAFIMFDGKRELNEVMEATAGLGVTPDDVTHLMSLGLLEISADAPASMSAVGPLAVAVIPEPPSAEAPAPAANGRPTASDQVHYLRAYPVAIRLTAKLGLRGFRLNLAVEAASDLDQLKQLAPKIRVIVGPEKFLELEDALYY